MVRYSESDSTQVDPKFRASPVTRPDTSQPRNRLASSGNEDARFARTDALHKAYSAVPDVRAEAVARAKALVASPSYPPPETIRKIANVLAEHLTAPED